MNDTIIRIKTKDKYLESRFYKIDHTLSALNLNMTLLNSSIRRGIIAIIDWDLFTNMSEEQFHNFIMLLKQINNFKFHITFEDRNNLKQTEINFVKLLVICAVFPNFMNTSLQKAILATIKNSAIKPRLLFSEIFNRYKVSNDFLITQTEVEDTVYSSFNKATFSRRKYLEFDMFTTFNDLHALLGIRNGLNIRTLNTTSFNISKKESFYFHSQNKLIKITNNKEYIKRRIIASKFAVLCEEKGSFIRNYGYRVFSEKINFIEHYLNSNKIFIHNIDIFYNDIDFWKSGFRILLNSNCKLYEIQSYVDYLEFKRYYLTTNFTLKSKTYSNILKDIQEWHDQISYGQMDGEPIVWGSKEEGSLKKITVKNKIYEYQQIINSYELYIEGKEKRHCVYTYLKNCVDKLIQIWRLNEIHTNRGLTIEVENNKIIQASGKFNKTDQYLEKNVLTVMAKKEGFTIKM